MKKLSLLITLLFIWTCSSPTKSKPAPKPPTVNNLSITTNEDTPATFTMTGSDPEGAALTFSISTQPTNGTVTISGAAGTYTPKENYHGQDTFAYIASDGTLSSTAGLVSVTITAVDDDPNTMDVTATTDEDTSVTITLEAEEVDGDNITFQLKTNPSNGSVTISGNQATYTPNENYYGSDSFTFEAVDSSAKRMVNVATASITINPVNDAPVVEDISLEGWNTEDLTVTLTGYDVEEDDISFHIVDDPTKVGASIEGTTLTIKKSSAFWGADSLTYAAYDGTEYGPSATVYFTFKRYINYNRSSYELKHSDYWYEQYYFRNKFNDESLGYSSGVSEADFNGDGFTDVLVPMDHEVNIRRPLRLFLNDGDNANFTEATSDLIKNNLGTIFYRKELIGDFNGDNYPDIFFLDTGTHADWNAHESSLMSNGDGTYTNIIYDNFPTYGYTHGGASADVDLDGDLDILICASHDDIEAVLFENDGSGNFTVRSSVIDDQERLFWEAEFYDINGDNYPDLIAHGSEFAPPYKNISKVFFNDGLGNFNTSNSVDLPEPENPIPNSNLNLGIIDFLFKDLNKDGNIEIIASGTWEYKNSHIIVFSHSGDFIYEEKTSEFIENYFLDVSEQDDVIYRLRLQDIDGNGRLDLFNDLKDAKFWSQPIRWEWNGSKFIPQF
jgi:hypothetical protein